jgi:hypothetical protein
MKVHYPNSWYVEQEGALESWWPLLTSVVNKSYAMGYLNALDSFNPHPAYRLITNKGELFEVRHARSAVKTAAVADDGAGRKP